METVSEDKSVIEYIKAEPTIYIPEQKYDNPNKGYIYLKMSKNSFIRLKELIGTIIKLDGNPNIHNKYINIKIPKNKFSDLTYMLKARKVNIEYIDGDYTLTSSPDHISINIKGGNYDNSDNNDNYSSLDEYLNFNNYINDIKKMDNTPSSEFGSLEEYIDNIRNISTNEFGNLDEYIDNVMISNQQDMSLHNITSSLSDISTSINDISTSINDISTSINDINISTNNKISEYSNLKDYIDDKKSRYNKEELSSDIFIKNDKKNNKKYNKKNKKDKSNINIEYSISYTDLPDIETPLSFQF